MHVHEKETHSDYCFCQIWGKSNHWASLQIERFLSPEATPFVQINHINKTPSSRLLSQLQTQRILSTLSG